MNDEDIVLIYHHDNFFCTKRVFEIADENSNGPNSPSTSPSPDDNPPSLEVEDILRDDYTPPSEDGDDTLPTTSAGPPVNEEEKESVEEKKEYLQVSSYDDSSLATVTNNKQEKNKI